MLLRSAAASLSRRDSSVGSSSWKNESWRLPSLSRVPALVWTGFLISPFLALTMCWESFISRAFNVFSALWITSLGIPAILATWIPKLCAVPPSLSLRRKITCEPTSFTAMWKFRTLEYISSRSLSS